MIQYQATPDYYRDYIEHGWLQNAAKKAHKYIDKYMKNGKWVYRYKSKAQEVGTKVRRKLNGADPSQISLNYGREPIFGYSRDNGKATSRTGTRGNFQNWKGKDVVPSSGHTNGLRVNAGIAAGRRRAKKAATIKNFEQHLLRKSFPHNASGVYRDYGRRFRTEVQKRKDNVYGTGIESKYLRNPRAGSTRGQGYSSSIGSADNNKATNRALTRKRKKK